MADIFRFTISTIAIGKPPHIYESFDPNTIRSYADSWAKDHSVWIGVDPNQAIYCDKDQITFPVCVGGELIQSDKYAISGAECGKMFCTMKSDSGCGVTPPDTMDYLPPPVSITDIVNGTQDYYNTTLCPVPSYLFDQIVPNNSFGLDQGLPPEYLPITPIGLNISGRIFARYNDRCEVVSNAEIIAWQINPLQLQELTFDAKNRYKINTANQTYPDINGPYSKLGPLKSFRDMSCRANQLSGPDGSYNFETSMPPSYGPPRHIMFSISAPGLETLTTRVYFDKDWRLQQLTTLGGNEVSYEMYSAALAHGFKTDQNDWTGRQFPGIIAEDPRVATLQFHHTEILSNEGLAKGYFIANQDFYLSAVRSSDPRDTSTMPPINLDGLWSDSEGSIIEIETHGSVFSAREYPHPRTWSLVYGYLVGNNIYGVSFRQDYTRNKLAEADPNSFLGAVQYVQSDSLSHGLIIPFDPFSSAPNKDPNEPGAASIQWSGPYQSLWSKQSYRLSLGYRYMKIMVFATTGLFAERDNQQIISQYGKGLLAINEIVFYEGALRNIERPTKDMKMKFPRSPAPQVVSCSSFDDQDHHCYKAFDGDASSASAWFTKPVGSHDNILTEPQWILLDSGAGRGIRPSAMKIICNLNDFPTKECPAIMTVMGSSDNIKYDTLMRVDLSNYNGEYGTDQGKIFYFNFDTYHGRVNGQSCGSCAIGPSFNCYLDAYDSTCDSRYCNQDGLCAAVPTCEAGQYLSMHQSVSSAYSILYSCELCPAGRFGNSTGLNSSICSGWCQSGYYCPPGSTSATQMPCGDRHSYCPLGSPLPLPAPSGRKTISALYDAATGEDFGDGSTQIAAVVCSQGHYCSRGVEIPCPIGKYGESLQLPNSDCDGECWPGTYCPAGTVYPVPCSTGHFCKDGRYALPCTPGTFGNTTGKKG